MHLAKWVAGTLLAGVLIALAPSAPVSSAQEDLEAVLAELRAAYAADPDPDLRYQIGKILFELERFDEAGIALEAYLDEVEDPTGERKKDVQSLLYQIMTGEHPLFRKAKNLIAEKQYAKAKETLLDYLEESKDTLTEIRRSQVQALLAEIENSIGSVTFSCNVQGATVYMSGVFVGTIPDIRPIELDEGEYPIEIGASGYKPASKIVEITGGEDKHIKVLLTKTGSMETCEGITCSGHGTCIISSGFPQCLCEDGYMGSSTGLECLPPKNVPAGIRAQAIVSIALSAMGGIGMVAGPIMLMTGPDDFNAGLAITISSGVLLSVGVPLGVETLARYSRVYNAYNLRGSYIGGRVFTIAGFAVAVPLLVSGIVTMIYPMTVIAMTHFLGLAATGISMAARAIVAARKRKTPDFPHESAIFPLVSPIPGGATLGIGGCF